MLPSVALSAFETGEATTVTVNFTTFSVLPVDAQVSPALRRDPKAKMLYLQSFPRKGVSLGYVGRNKT